MEWLQNTRGTLRLSTPLYGDHDGIMTHPMLLAAILRAFRSVDKRSEKAL
jgi:hypothetical protein